MPASRKDSRDGQFDLYYRNGWAHLTVWPPQEGGRPVYRDEIQNRMKILRVPRADGADIARIIEEADGEPHPLVEWPDGNRLASVITVTVPEDKLSAAVIITAPKRGAYPPTPEEVVAALEAHGVRYGIEQEAVRALLREERWETSTIVASGTPPVHARPASIRYHFNPDRGKPYLEMESGRINLRELNFIENKSAGALLAELEPPVAPMDGRAVTGEVLPASTTAESVELVAGENTENTDGGRAIHATADGNVRLVEGAVTVEPVVTVENVDYETGNITFDGSVLVEKSIVDGFVVTAGGDVQVGRSVGRATITAGGNVLLKAGINGGEEGQIECAGTLAAKYVEGASVRCTGSVFVEEAIMHSELSVSRHCVLTGRRAEIIASEVTAGGSVWCKKLGSIAEPETRVSIGVPPDLISAHVKAVREHERLAEDLEKRRKELAHMERLIADGREDSRLPAARDQLASRVAELEAAVGEARNNSKQLREQLQSAQDALLVVEDTMYKGSVVTFGRAEFRPPARGAHGTVLSVKHGEIRESGFNPQEKPTLDFQRDDGYSLPL